jgi:parallel beta-helix repeat protein
VTKDATWSSAIPYYIVGNMIVQGNDGTDGTTTLTIAPGAKLRFNASRYLNIGGNSGNPGALIAQGTSDSQIVFTSNKATPAAGDWYGVRLFTTADDSTVLGYCIVEYAGYGNQGALYLYNTKAAVKNCTIHHNQDKGLYLYGTGSNDSDIQCNTFVDNAYGIFLASNSLPSIQDNNFAGNTSYGLYNASSVNVVAENNWWGDVAGANAAGDATYGNVDTDPWSGQQNQCTAAENYPPFAPTAPAPADNAVRVASESGVVLTWSCSDPNAGDTLTYDLLLGTTPDNLHIQAQGLNDATYTMTGLGRGTTCYWQVTAKDNVGLSKTGDVWQFTTNGDPPDLTVSELTTTPAGGMQLNSTVTLFATITNSGSGPVVDSFSSQFSADGSVIGTVTTDQIIAPGASVQVSLNWYYAGGDPELEVRADSSDTVTETNESNNKLRALLSLVADITAPSLAGHSPADNSELQQVQQISFTLIDMQSAIDDAAVMAAFALTDASQQPVQGQISESSDTFTFVPESLPLPDDAYEASVTALDTFGNIQIYTFSFTIDTVPPAKPVITGGVVSSGTIQPRPADNKADRVAAVLEGTREAHTSLWVNGELKVPIGSEPWSCQIGLSPGDNALEILSKDAAGNSSLSEWVDIQFTGQGGVVYEYDAAGRIKRIQTLP